MPSIINKIIYMDELLSYSAHGDQKPKGVEVEGHLRSVCVCVCVPLSVSATDNECQFK